MTTAWDNRFMYTKGTSTAPFEPYKVIICGGAEGGKNVVKEKKKVHYIEVVLQTCEYCGCKSYNDIRGNCNCCGAPRKSYYEKEIEEEPKPKYSYFYGDKIIVVDAVDFTKSP